MGEKCSNREEKRSTTTEEESEISSFLHLLCLGSHITRRVLLQRWHDTWLCYKAPHRHYELRQQLISHSSSSSSSSSHPRPPDYSSQWECKPSALSLDLQPPLPPHGYIHASIFHSQSPSYEVDSSWPLWTETHMPSHQYTQGNESGRKEEKRRTEELQRGLVIKIHWLTN